MRKDVLVLGLVIMVAGLGMYYFGTTNQKDATEHYDHWLFGEGDVVTDQELYDAGAAWMERGIAVAIVGGIITLAGIILDRSK